MPSPRQRAANRANSLKSTGPKSEEGKFRAKLNSSKHGLSLPVDERVFADQIKRITELIREDCSTQTQAQELLNAQKFDPSESTREPGVPKKVAKI